MDGNTANIISVFSLRRQLTGRGGRSADVAIPVFRVALKGFEVLKKQSAPFGRSHTQIQIAEHPHPPSVPLPGRPQKIAHSLLDDLALHVRRDILKFQGALRHSLTQLLKDVLLAFFPHVPLADLQKLPRGLPQGIRADKTLLAVAKNIPYRGPAFSV